MRRALWAACVVGAIFACTAPRKDELECEEAVAHLQECCPGFDARPLKCLYEEGCGSTTYPAIAVDDATCIRDRSCDDLVNHDVCRRAQNAQAPTLDAGAAQPSSGVCP